MTFSSKVFISKKTIKNPHWEEAYQGQWLSTSENILIQVIPNRGIVRLLNPAAKEETELKHASVFTASMIDSDSIVTFSAMEANIWNIKSLTKKTIPLFQEEKLTVINAQVVPGKKFVILVTASPEKTNFYLLDLETGEKNLLKLDLKPSKLFDLEIVPKTKSGEVTFAATLDDKTVLLITVDLKSKSIQQYARPINFNGESFTKFRISSDGKFWLTQDAKTHSVSVWESDEQCVFMKKIITIPQVDEASWAGGNLIYQHLRSDGKKIAICSFNPNDLTTTELGEIPVEKHHLLISGFGDQFFQISNSSLIQQCQFQKERKEDSLSLQPVLKISKRLPRAIQIKANLILNRLELEMSQVEKIELIRVLMARLDSLPDFSRESRMQCVRDILKNVEFAKVIDQEIKILLTEIVNNVDTKLVVTKSVSEYKEGLVKTGAWVVVSECGLVHVRYGEEKIGFIDATTKASKELEHKNVSSAVVLDEKSFVTASFDVIKIWDRRKLEITKEIKLGDKEGLVKTLQVLPNQQLICHIVYSDGANKIAILDVANSKKKLFNIGIEFISSIAVLSNSPGKLAVMTPEGIHIFDFDLKKQKLKHAKLLEINDSPAPTDIFVSTDGRFWATKPAGTDVTVWSVDVDFNMKKLVKIKGANNPRWMGEKLNYLGERSQVWEFDPIAMTHAILSGQSHGWSTLAIGSRDRNRFFQIKELATDQAEVDVFVVKEVAQSDAEVERKDSSVVVPTRI